MDDRIFGVLNVRQIEHFCKRFNLELSDLMVNFDGWRKLVLIAGEKVYLFPRDPRGVEWLDREATAYELFNDIPALPVPRLLERVKDPDISYYEFIVASRLYGTPYSLFEEEVTAGDVERMLLNLTETISLWHKIPIDGLPAKIREETSSIAEELYQWENKVLKPSTTIEAFEHVHGKILEEAEKYNQTVLKIFRSAHVRTLWTNCMKEIVALQPVLLHADVHEDQILVDSKESMEITGILDWETVRVGNPVWDFNFNEWGFGIWKWWKHFSEYRRKMWKGYLERRGIQLEFLEGLNLFYTLSEFLTVLQPDKPLGELIGGTRENSIKLCLDRLVDITRRMVD